MDYDRIDGPEGLEIRVARDDGYRTCAVCGGDCELDTSLSADGAGVRVAFVCLEHGIQSVIDPFADLR
ncbi:hypothetical protein PU630_15490 [Microbacterium horticulturae]|uniref:Uncharacterized protein n=1 Tax=Microbacterium horticulturae TaxID=3028316 RepID=A0ABY8C1X7_9MICO|nr:hypothetical protein [Microbacterium sp. KACC 23027]WEG08628.1 hypothetical protein PU630_15490 [Microbacterium sp. KACC 23027]